MKRFVILCAALAALPALADSEYRSAKPLPIYKTECGSCHTAFPAAFLNKAGWQQTMANLERHFGTDASIDGKDQIDILVYLERNAGGRDKAPAKGEPRLTSTAWFKHEHREVPSAVWKDARVKSAANCIACHTGADQGRYGEAEIRIPGMKKRHQYKED